MKLIYFLLVLFLSTFLTGCIDLAANDGRDKQRYIKLISKTKAQVYTMRGGLGGVFSKGMNHLQDALKVDHQFYVSSTVWYKSGELSRFIIEKQKTGQTHGPIVLVGHSLGANEQIQVAKALAKEHIKVALLITVDAVYPLTIPSNVDYALNIYKPFFVPLFSGLRLSAVDPQHTTINNLNVDVIKGVDVNHFTIDGNHAIQTLMLDEIHKIVRNKK